MKSVLAGAAALVLLSIPAVAVATPITYHVTLLGANENPVVPSPGVGSADVTIDDVAHQLSINLTFSGLLGTTTASHIHCCALPPTNALVATQTPSFIGFPLGVTAGSFSNVFNTLDSATYRAGFITDHGGTAAGAEAALFAGIADGQAYLNIHTNLFPGGEIRGQLTPVPEPASMLLLATGLAGAGVRRWKGRASA